MAGKDQSSVVWKISIALGLLVLAAYWPVWKAEFTNYDDPYYVTNNPHVIGGFTLSGIRWAFSNTETGNWHPITWLSHMLDCQLFGLRPTGHHLTSVMLHAINTALLFVLLHTMTQSRWRSAIVAALFGLHPLHVESVAWISERKDVLNAFFGLLCLLAYVHSVRSVGARRWRYYALALLFFCLGLMTKPMLVTWPCVLLLLDYWPLGTVAGGALNRSFQKLLLEKVPFFAASAIFCVVALVAQKAGGAMPSLEQVSIGLRIANAVHSYVVYLEKLVFPHNLAVIYPSVHNLPPAVILLEVLILAGVTLSCWLQRQKRPWLIVGWAWFMGTLVPVIGLVQVGNQAMADRYTYLPAIGFFLMIVWSASDWVVARRRLQPLVGALAGAALLIALCGTMAQAAYWRNSETLFQHTVEVTENNFIAYNSLGFHFFDRGEMEKAKSCFQKALAINPASHIAWEKLGAVSIEQGDPGAAISSCHEALRLKPDMPEAHATLGLIYVRQGLIADGISEYRTAIHLRPGFAAAHYNLANALVRQGMMDEAVQHFRESVRLDPGSADAHNNFGFLLAREGHFEEAIEQFRQALALRPGLWQARFGLGSALEKIGSHEAAARELAEVRKDHPELFRARPLEEKAK